MWEARYGVAMPRDTTATPPPLRMTVRDPRRIERALIECARDEPWTQTELAATLGVSRAMISHLVSGRRKSAPADFAIRLSEALGYQPAVLFKLSVLTNSDTKASA